MFVIGNLLMGIANVLHIVLYGYMFVLIINSVLSFLPQMRYSPFKQGIETLSNIVLNPLRRVIRTHWRYRFFTVCCHSGSDICGYVSRTNDCGYRLQAQIKMITSIALLYNPHKDGIKTKVFDLKDAFIKSGIAVSFTLSTETDYASYEQKLQEQEIVGSGQTMKPDMIVVLGGDGSVLRSLPIAVDKGIPVAGINFGKFGFMTRYEYETVLENPKVIRESKISERALLKIISDGENGENRECLALNDVVMQRINLNLVRCMKSV